MGNIGSEVGRTFHAELRGEDYREVMARALDLFDATVSNPKLSAPRRREILRAKEEYLSAIDNQSKRSGIENYFMQFAIAARITR